MPLDDTGIDAEKRITTMTILGIDYGSRWIGLALGNAETKFAFPCDTLEQGRFLFTRIKELCREENVGGIVVGAPRIWHATGALNKKIENFAEKLRRRLGLPVALVEEIFTSSLARALAPEHARHSTHAQAAALIVENYFYQITHPAQPSL